MANPKVPCIELSDGFNMPIVGLGTWQGTTETDEDAVTANVEVAINVGYRHVDTAQIYNTEVAVGRAVTAAIEKGVVKREDLFITTKLWVGHMRREDVVRHLRKSLDRLKLDYVDLFLIHWPCPVKPSETEEVPKDANGEIIYADEIDYVDTWKGMEEAHDLGLTKHIGISNFNKRQIQRLLANCKTRPKNNQVEASMFFQNTKLIGFCHSENISVTGYRNLQHITEQSSADSPSTDVLQSVAKRVGKTVQQVALRYQIQRGMAVVPKSADEKRMKQNLEVVNFTLPDDDMKELGSLDVCKRSLDMFPGSKHYPCADPY